MAGRDAIDVPKAARGGRAVAVPFFWAERSACAIWVSLGSSGALLGKTLGAGPPPSRSRLGGRAGRVQKKDRPVCFLDGARLPVERAVNFWPKSVPFLLWQGSC